MIVSHKHKFIFIKTKKTAGTSIEIALSELCGDSDVITPISPEDELTRLSLGYRGPQNFMFDGKVIFYNHIGWRQVKKYLGDDIWNNYYKFCFERNPWDKVISWYYWEHKQAPRPTLFDFVSSGHAQQVGGHGGIELYADSGVPVVDRVCLFENITEELEGICSKLNLPNLGKLPRAKSKFRIDKRPYKELFDERSQAIIAKQFSREIELFDFKY